MNSRTASPDAPLNIYEMHLGSWMRNPDDANGWYTYDEIARRLIPYLQENGYTHVEFLPLSEHRLTAPGATRTPDFCSDLALRHAGTAENAD